VAIPQNRFTVSLKPGERRSKTFHTKVGNISLVVHATFSVVKNRVSVSWDWEKTERISQITSLKDVKQALGIKRWSKDSDTIRTEETEYQKLDYKSVRVTLLQRTSGSESKVFFCK
jgi:hypothetical protein